MSGSERPAFGHSRQNPLLTHQRDEPLTPRTARRIRARYQNGARPQGFAAPRLKTGAPLRAARRSGRIDIATGGSGGMSLQANLFATTRTANQPRDVYTDSRTLPTEIALKHPISHNFSKGGLHRPIHGLVLHIQEGTEKGTYSWFNNPESKASSHFGNPKHGRLEQFVDTNNMAWTQRSGNHNWISIENEGKHGDSLTPTQIDNVAALMYWLHENERVPLKLANSPEDFGLGYHSMGGKAWGHQQCPGTPIIKQRPLIIALAIFLKGVQVIEDGLSGRSWR